MRHEAIGNRLNEVTNCLLPTRGEANVQQVVTSNFLLASFSITNRVASADPRLCPVTT